MPESTVRALTVEQGTDATFKLYLNCVRQHVTGVLAGLGRSDCFAEYWDDQTSRRVGAAETND